MTPHAASSTPLSVGISHSQMCSRAAVATQTLHVGTHFAICVTCGHNQTSQNGDAIACGLCLHCPPGLRANHTAVREFVQMHSH
jgi:hypothetical protein